jgi:hypothetical protein
MSSNQIIAVNLRGKKRAWLAYCAQNGDKPTAAIADLVLKKIEAETLPATAEGGREQTVFSQRKNKPDDSRIRKEIRLTNSEVAALEKLAKERDMSFQMLVVSILRGVLTQTPQFSGDEIKAVWGSNSQLLAIGRNLNQVATRLNEARKLNQNVDDGLIRRAIKVVGEVSEKIDKQMETVNAMTAANLQRWEIYPGKAKSRGG